MSPRTTNWTRIRSLKSTVNGRRVNRETKRHKLAVATFVNLPRLVTDSGYKLPKSV